MIEHCVKVLCLTVSKMTSAQVKERKGICFKTRTGNAFKSAFFLSVFLVVIKVGK